MKVLVTGCAGFLGSNLVRRLLNKGHEVMGLDNLSSGSKQNMLGFLFDPMFHFIVHDITTSIPLSGIDLVIHCALPPREKDILHFYKTCTYGAFTVAGIARRNNAPLICFSSNEDSEDSISLDMMENILNAYPLRTRVLRLPKLFGHQKGDWISDTLLKIFRNEDVFLAFQPEQEIGFVWVDDLLDYILKIIGLGVTKGSQDVYPSKLIKCSEFFRIACASCDSHSSISYNYSEIIPPPHIEDSEIAKTSYDLGIEMYLKNLASKEI